MGGGHDWGRITAIIFSDVVSSTELLYAVGSERNEGLRRSHLADLRAALRDHGGRQVKNLGDGIMAVVPSAAGAVAAAVAMQQRTNAQARAAGLDLRITVGASIGDAVEDESDWFGPAVVEAARLCDLADPGEILVTKILRDLAEPGLDVAFQLLGPRRLKGIPEPVEVHAVQWPPAPDVALELPAMLTGHGRFEMVGREAERAKALEAWEVASHGTRRVLLVCGEPGVGKSRLTAEVAATVHAYGGQVLLGRCDPEGGGPFQPFVVALRQHLQECRARGEAVDLGPNAGALARLVPELPATRDSPPTTSDPAADRLALFDAIAEAFHRIADRAPLLLVLEDAHWAAAETVQLLRHVIGWTRDASMLVVVTLRTTEVDGESGLGQLLAESVRLVRCTRINLHGLAERDIVGLLTGGETPTTDVAALARALHEQTDGNALYTTQLLAHALESGIVQRTGPGDGLRMADDAQAGLRLPESLRDVVLGRVRSAGPDVARLLEMAAVAGERFDPLLLSQVDDLEGRLSDALDDAVQANLVEHVGASDEYRFVHALVRSTVGERLSTLRRARIHDRMAETMEAMGAGAASLLAHHAGQAAMLGPALAARAVRLARRAGDEAMAALEFRAAADWYQVALDHRRPRPEDGPDDVRARIEILTALGIAQRDAGIPAFRETLLEAAGSARDAGAVDVQVLATLANTRGTFANAKGLDDERIGMLRSTLAVVPDASSTERAQLLSLLAMELGVGPGFPERYALSSQALDLARTSGDEATLAWVLARRDPAIVHLTTIDERCAEADELIGLVARRHDELLRFWADHHGVKIGFELGDRARIEASLERLETLATTLRHPEPGVFVLRDRATYASIRGDFAAAERWADESVELGARLGVPDAWKIWTSQHFSIRFMQGRLGQLREGMENTNRARWSEAVWAGWSLICADTGDVDAAHQSLEIQHDVDFLDYPTGHTATAGIAAAALAAGRVGDATLAARLLPLLDRAAGRCIAEVAYWYGPVDHHRGLLRGVLGDLDAAADCLGAAIDMERRLGAKPWLARSLAELARVLRHRAGTGDGAAAAAATTEATELASALDILGIDVLAGEALAPVSGAGWRA